MQVTVNQQAITLNNKHRALDKLIEQLELEPTQVAVAINQTIIPKSSWALTSLTEGDDIAIFSMIAGG